MYVIATSGSLAKLASFGTLGFKALSVNGKHLRSLLFIINCAGEYGVPVMGVLRSSSRANASSFPPSFAFLNNFLHCLYIAFSKPVRLRINRTTGLHVDVVTSKLHCLLN